MDTQSRPGRSIWSHSLSHQSTDVGLTPQFNGNSRKTDIAWPRMILIWHTAHLLQLKVWQKHSVSEMFKVKLNWAWVFVPHFVTQSCNILDQWWLVCSWVCHLVEPQHSASPTWHSALWTLERDTIIGFYLDFTDHLILLLKKKKRKNCMFISCHFLWKVCLNFL